MKRSTLAIAAVLAVLSLPAIAGKPAEPAAESPYLQGVYAKAVRGDTGAQYNLALAYHNGQDVDKDDTLAAKWLKSAAGRGDIQAQLNYGDFLRDGIGVKQNPVEAVKWYSAAAGRGSAEAEYSLALMYQTGTGVPGNKPDNDTAIKWLAKSASQGFPPAQVNLGMAYLQGGSGVESDYELAYFWFSLAANQKYPEGVTYRDRVAKTLRADQLDAVEKKINEWKPTIETTSNGRR